MTIQQCRYVLEISKRGSFNEAAKTLFTAQSSLSASVRSLEKELGIKIFERSKYGVYLTEAGAEFVRYASHIVEQNDFILDKYQGGKARQKLYIATQHYDFVADVFSKMLNCISDDHYTIALRETQTYNVGFVSYLINLSDIKSPVKTVINTYKYFVSLVVLL